VCGVTERGYVVLYLLCEIEKRNGWSQNRILYFATKMLIKISE